MIDLCQTSLPETLVVDGGDYRIKTDFRVWLKVSRCIDEQGIIPATIFADEVPPGDSWGDAAAEFLLSANNVPHGSKPTNRVMDYLEDSDYIVAAFQQVYGIDLTSCRMHWHRFLALLRGLPEGCKLTEIIGYRCWRKTSAKYESRMERLRKEWALPDKGGMTEAEAVAYQQAAFGDVVEAFRQQKAGA